MLTLTEIAKKYKTDKCYIEALEKSMGIMNTACKKSGVSRSWVYQQLEKDPVFRKNCEDITEIQQDFGESQLLELVNDKNPAAVIFYNKCKNKKRGYRENEDSYKDNMLTMMILWNKFLMQQNAQVSEQLHDIEQKFMDLVLQSTSKDHLTILIDKPEEPKLIEAKNNAI